MRKRKKLRKRNTLIKMRKRYTDNIQIRKIYSERNSDREIQIEKYRESEGSNQFDSLFKNCVQLFMLSPSSRLHLAHNLLLVFHLQLAPHVQGIC